MSQKGFVATASVALLPSVASTKSPYCLGGRLRVDTECIVHGWAAASPFIYHLQNRRTQLSYLRTAISARNKAFHLKLISRHKLLRRPSDLARCFEFSTVKVVCTLFHGAQEQSGQPTNQPANIQNCIALYTGQLIHIVSSLFLRAFPSRLGLAWPGPGLAQYFPFPSPPHRDFNTTIDNLKACIPACILLPV